MTREIFIKYVHFFMKSIPARRPVVLVVDGHTSRFDYDSLQLLESNNIYCFCIPSHTSQFMQPNDVSLSGIWQKNCVDMYNDWRLKNPVELIEKKVSNLVISETFNKTKFEVSKIKNGWEKSGIFPLNINKCLENINLNLNIKENNVLENSIDVVINVNSDSKNIIIDSNFENRIVIPKVYI